MPSNRSLSTAQKLVERCNRERLQIDALETRLYELRKKHRRSYAAMYNALPDRYAISLHPTEPWVIVGPSGDARHCPECGGPMEGWAGEHHSQQCEIGNGVRS